MTKTFRVIGLAASLAMGAAFAASAQSTNGSTGSVGTGTNGGVSAAVPGAGSTTHSGAYGVPGSSATSRGYNTSQSTLPGSQVNQPGMNGGTSGGTSGVSSGGDSGAGAGGTGAGGTGR